MENNKYIYIYFIPLTSVWLIVSINFFCNNVGNKMGFESTASSVNGRGYRDITRA